MEKYKLSIHIFVFLIISTLCRASETINVKLQQGELSGRVEKTFLKNLDFYAFRGIPFAEPPIGSLRFKPPVAHNRWENVYEAYERKPTCLQFSSRKETREEYDVSGSEDCLYINVFTTNLKDSAPVIVFEFNDNFRTSYNGTDSYSPDFFMEENIVVVTISHRLAALGYLTTEDDIIPPNAGLKDYVMGLNWVKDNILQFGGDPNRVTLMGSRGGAVLGEILLYSKKADNLFNSVILQSGTALESDFFNNSPRVKAFQLGEKLNITVVNSQDLLTELQKVDVATIYSKLNEIAVDSEEDENFFFFSPVIENDYPDAIITSLPENSEIINDVPIIIGMNSREGLDLIRQYLQRPKLLDDVAKDFRFLIPIRTDYKFDLKSELYKNATEEIIEFYFKQGYIYHGSVLDYAVYIGDILQNYALNQAAKRFSQKMNSPVYYYMFDFKGQLNENMVSIEKYLRFSVQPWGATTLDELCYLHLCNRIRDVYEEIISLVSEQPEIKVLKKMVRLWTNFAKTGNPTPSKEDKVLKNFSWKPISKNSDDIAYAHITKSLEMKTNPLDKREIFWNNFLKKYETLTIDGIVQTVKNDVKRDEL